MKIYELFRFGAVIIVACLGSGCGVSREVASIKNDAPRGGEENVAKKMFEQRCLNADEKIYKRIENVDGIFLLKLRPDKINFSDQYLLDDPYGRDFNGDAYILSFLRGFYENNYGKPDHPLPSASPHTGYRYVDAVDPKDDRRYRYVGVVETADPLDLSYTKDYSRFVLKRSVPDSAVPQYGVSYEDISTKEERDHWIAGSSLKVIDMKTNEILAERIGYMYDPGQGASSGGRSPWMIAASHSCPSFGTHHGSASQALQAETFVGKVLKPSVY